MSTDLTSTEAGILDFITQFWAENSYAPTVREVGEAVGIASPSTTWLHLEQLKDKGRILSEFRRPRTIRLPREAECA